MTHPMIMLHPQGFCEGAAVGTGARRACAGVCGERAAAGCGHPCAQHQQDAVRILHLWGLLQVIVNGHVLLCHGCKHLAGKPPRVHACLKHPASCISESLGGSHGCHVWRSGVDAGIATGRQEGAAHSVECHVATPFDRSVVLAKVKRQESFRVKSMVRQSRIHSEASGAVQALTGVAMPGYPYPHP